MKALKPAFTPARALGAGRVRIGANWGEIETEPGRRRWDALDERVRIARQAGLEVERVVGFDAFGTTHHLEAIATLRRARG